MDYSEAKGEPRVRFGRQYSSEVRRLRASVALGKERSECVWR